MSHCYTLHARRKHGSRDIIIKHKALGTSFVFLRMNSEITLAAFFALLNKNILNLIHCVTIMTQYVVICTYKLRHLCDLLSHFDV